MTDWDRTEHVEAPPAAPPVVFLELFVGMVGAAILDLLVLALVGVVGAAGAVLEQVAGGWIVGVAFAFGAITLGALGVVQWAWLVPAIALSFRRRRAFALGLAIGGAVIVMLNGTCWATTLTATF